MLCSYKNPVSIWMVLGGTIKEDSVASGRSVIISAFWPDVIENEINNNFKRKIIVETLLKLKNEVSGEIETAIQDIYLKSNLKEHAYKQLKSKKK